jgi:hypothetical protein
LRLRVECIFFVIYQAGANPRFILLFSFDFLLQSGGAVVAVIVCWLNLQLYMHSVPIPLTLRVWTRLRRNVQHYVIKYSCLLHQ